MTNFKSWSADEEDDQVWDDLFMSHTEDVDYLNPEGPEGEIPYIGSSARIEVTTHGDKSEDTEILKTHEAPTENILLSVASMKPADKQPAETAFTEMLASEVYPPIEADTAKHITIGNVLTETIQDEAASSEVTITTSISAGNN